MVVSTKLKKSEGTFIDAMDECGVDAVQVSNYYASSLETHFHALDILPQCDNRIAMVELKKSGYVSMHRRFAEYDQIYQK
jgi:hypothetical protein